MTFGPFSEAFSLAGSSLVPGTRTGSGPVIGLSKFCGGESGRCATIGTPPALTAIQLHVSFYSSSRASGTVSYDGGMTLTPLAGLGPELTSDQRERYARQIRLPGFGEEGQRRLLCGKVLVIWGPAAWVHPRCCILRQPELGRSGLSTTTSWTSPTFNAR